MTRFDFSFRQIVESTNDIVIVTRADPLDPPGPEIVYVNRAFTELTGYTYDEAVGQSPRMLQSEKTERRHLDAVRNALSAGQAVRTLVNNRSKHGRGYWLDMRIMPLYDQEGRITHFAAIERDVTDRVEREQRLADQAHSDPLTGLFNRRAFEDVAAREHSRFDRGRRAYAAVMLDVDLFKDLNDNYGHSYGDMVLRAIAQGCLDNTRLHDTVARVGGEEFCLILPDSNREKALEAADKIRRTVADLRIDAEGHFPTITISLGVAVVDEQDDDHHAVLERADEALYRAKNEGRNRVCFAEPDPSNP